MSARDVDGQPRCVHCRRAFADHLPDCDRPDDLALRVCPRPPSQAERYHPDKEHAALKAENDGLRAKVAELENEIEGLWQDAAGASL